MTAGWAVAALAAGLIAWLAYRAGTARAARLTRELELVRQDLARRLNELFTLQELTYLLSESLQLDRIVTQVARYVTRFLDAEGALVALTGHDPNARVVAAEGKLAPLMGTVHRVADAGLIGAVIGRERLEVIEPGSDWPAPDVLGIPVRRIAVAPLRAHGVTVGALVVVDRSGGPFSADDLRLVSTVATHAAIVLANARFFDLIRAGKEQWESTFDALNAGLAALDAAGCVRRANRALARLLDRPVAEVIGLDLNRELLGGSGDLPALLDAARRGESRSGITAKARDRVLRITVSPMREAQTERWVVALVEDVTDQKALEAQLIQNEKMVAVGQLVSGVAHELNNPLTSITGLSEFLLEQPGGLERDREHLRVIREQAERASRIVRNLLTFARREGPDQHGPADLNDIAKHTVLLIEYELRLRQVELQLQLATGLPPARGDRHEFQQVVLNLLTNAVQAVAANPPERPRRIRVSTALHDDRVVLRVADTGPGIDPEHIASLFTPFFTTKQPGQGTGLGLSISFGIAERHGGRLYVEPTSEGAVFVLSLPASVDPLAATPAPAPPEELAAPGAESRAGPSEARRSILLVDEDPAVQRMIRALFSMEHQKVLTPPTASDAVRLLATGVYDLIIADPRAAVSSGETFAEAMLRHWPEHRTKTVFVTADVREETHEWLRRTGCAYLQKPFKIRELRATVERIWEHASGAPVDGGSTA